MGVFMNDIEILIINDVNEFEDCGRSIRFSNFEFLSRYVGELDSRNLDFRVVLGTGLYGMDIIICFPKNFEKHKSELIDAIVADQETLDRRRAGLVQLVEVYENSS